MAQEPGAQIRMCVAAHYRHGCKLIPAVSRSGVEAETINVRHLLVGRSLRSIDLVAMPI